ncbi:MAG: Arc family DNA-binding protein [Phycisphaerales bacterium]|nr:Arc family DNA-binding protein [Phycisphaerales bacterium]
MSQKRAFLLRLPPELWEEINRWAQAELRSVNGQIEYVLRQAVNKQRRRLTDVDETSAAEPDA